MYVLLRLGRHSTPKPLYHSIHLQTYSASSEGQVIADSEAGVFTDAFADAITLWLMIPLAAFTDAIAVVGLILSQ